MFFFRLKLCNMITIPANEILFGDLCNVLEQIHKKKKQRAEQDKIMNTFSIRVANTEGEKVCGKMFADCLTKENLSMKLVKYVASDGFSTSGALLGII